VETPTSIMEVDDEADEDSMAVLLDPDMGDGYWLCNVQHVIGMQPQTAPGNAQVHYMPHGDALRDATGTNGCARAPDSSSR
jgi:hypothetical protein